MGTQWTLINPYKGNSTDSFNFRNSHSVMVHTAWGKDTTYNSHYNDIMSATVQKSPWVDYLIHAIFKDSHWLRAFLRFQSLQSLQERGSLG